MEKWDVYDKNGRLAGKIKTSIDNWNQDEFHLSASLWIINQKQEVLIQKRSSNKKLFPNVWCTTGGSSKAGESSIQCCVREAFEEIGITVNPDNLIFLQRFFFKNIINDEYAVFMEFPVEHAVIQPDEVCDIKWVSVDEIKRLHLTHQFLIDSESDLNPVIKLIYDRTV